MLDVGGRHAAEDTLGGERTRHDRARKYERVVVNGHPPEGSCHREVIHTRRRSLMGSTRRFNRLPGVMAAGRDERSWDTTGWNRCSPWPGCVSPRPPRSSSRRPDAECQGHFTRIGCTKRTPTEPCTEGAQQRDSDRGPDDQRVVHDQGVDPHPECDGCAPPAWSYPSLCAWHNRDRGVGHVLSPRWSAHGVTAARRRRSRNLTSLEVAPRNACPSR